MQNLSVLVIGSVENVVKSGGQTLITRGHHDPTTSPTHNSPDNLAARGCRKTDQEKIGG